MRRISRLIVLAAGLSVLAPGPSAWANQSSWGFRAGWSSAKPGGEALGESREALTGGLTFNWDLGWAFQVRIEALLSRKGGSGIISGVGYGCGIPDVLLRVDARLDYLEFPMLAKWHPGRGDVYFTAGPFLGVLISDEVTSCEAYDCLGLPFICAGQEVYICAWQPTVGLLSDVDSGVILGLGHEFSLKGAAATVDLRYHYGLKDINRFNDYVLRTRLISVTAGVTLF